MPIHRGFQVSLDRMNSESQQYVRSGWKMAILVGGLLPSFSAISSWSGWSTSSPADAETVIQRSVVANAEDWKAAPHYDHFERDQQPNGGTKTYQITMIEGSPYQRLVEVNGQPLSEELKAQEQKKLDETSEHRRKESASERSKRITKYQKERERDRALMDQLTKALDFSLAGEERVDGHNTYVLNASPRPGYKPPNMETEVLTGMQGKLWIDTKTYQWVKVEAEVIHPVSIAGFLARVEPGTQFQLEKMPVGNGIWLPKHFSMKATAKVLAMFNHNEATDEHYWNYRKSGLAPSESTDK